MCVLYVHSYFSKACCMCILTSKKIAIFLIKNFVFGRHVRVARAFPLVFYNNGTISGQQPPGTV
jgi:hypothetical protein